MESRPWQRLDRALERLGSAARALLPFAAGGLLLGAAAWWGFHWDQRSYHFSNRLPAEQRAVAALWGLVGGLLGSIGAAAAGAVNARGTGVGWTESLRQLRSRLSAWLLGAAGLTFLAQGLAPGAEAKVRGLVLLSTSAAAAALAGAYYRLANRPRVESPAPPAPGPARRALAGAARVLPAMVLVAAMAAYALRLSTLSIATHRAGKSHLDLAVYENVLWHTGQGRFLECTLCKGGSHASSHFDPVLGLLSLAYRLVPDTATLLTAQSVWLASAAIPIFLISKKSLGAWGALAISVCYLLSPALHGANLFGFHSLVLCLPLVLTTAYALERGRWLAYVLSLGALLLVREDMALVAFGIALYAFSLGRRILALGTATAAFAYLATVKAFFMPDPGLIMADSSVSVSFAHYFRQLIPYEETGARALGVSLLGNPSYLLRVGLREDKVLYYGVLLAPVLGLPLLAPRRLWVCLWGGVFVLLASRQAVFSPHFQYSSLLLPGLFFALPQGIERLSNWAAQGAAQRARVKQAAVLACVVASLALASQFGALKRNGALRGGWAVPAWNASLEGTAYYRRVRALAETIPAEAELATTRDLAPYVAGRAARLLELDDAPYLFFDRRHMTKPEKKRLRQTLRGEAYTQVGGGKKLQVFRRSPAAGARKRE